MPCLKERSALKSLGLDSINSSTTFGVGGQAGSGNPSFIGSQRKETGRQVLFSVGRRTVKVLLSHTLRQMDPCVVGWHHSLRDGPRRAAIQQERIRFAPLGHRRPHTQHQLWLLHPFQHLSGGPAPFTDRCILPFAANATFLLSFSVHHCNIIR